MNTETVYDRQRWTFPRVGQRIVKTSIAVFLCLVIYYLRGYEGGSMPTEAMITAILCMQPYVRDSRDYAVSRLTGTLIGAFWGLMFLLFLTAVHSEGDRRLILYAGMAVGVLVSLHSAVLIGKPDTAGLAAIVFLCVVIAFPDIEDPLRQAGLRIVDLFIGTLVLMSEHAPAFFALQMSETKLNTPLIVMDGAAIFDANENRYLSLETLPAEDSERLTERLRALNISYFIYTVHRNKTCIFHNGELREPEKKVLERMKRSPYRDYLDGEGYEPDEIVYFKVLGNGAEIAEIEHHLRHSLPKSRLRSVIRRQAGAEEVYGLYIYAHTASMDQAKKRLMARLREEDPSLVPMDVRLPGPYRSELDAMHILHTVGNLYEPIRLFPRRRRKLKAGDPD